MKNFVAFPSNCFTFIVVIRFDNLITNDMKTLTQKYLNASKANTISTNKNSNKNRCFQKLENTDEKKFRSSSFLKKEQEPKFQQQNIYRPTILTLKSLNGDLFEVFVNLEEEKTQICLQVTIEI